MLLELLWYYYTWKFIYLSMLSLLLFIHTIHCLLRYFRLYSRWSQLWEATSTHVRIFKWNSWLLVHMHLLVSIFNRPMPFAGGDLHDGERKNRKVSVHIIVAPRGGWGRRARKWPRRQASVEHCPSFQLRSQLKDHCWSNSPIISTIITPGGETEEDGGRSTKRIS